MSPWKKRLKPGMVRQANQSCGLASIIRAVIAELEFFGLCPPYFLYQWLTAMDLRSLLHSWIAAIAMAAWLWPTPSARAVEPAKTFLPQNGDRIVLLCEGLIERE